MKIEALKTAAEKAGMTSHFLNGSQRDDMYIIGKDFIDRLHAEIVKASANSVEPVEQEPVAWGILSDTAPELTNDPELGAYWERKGRKVEPLYCKAKVPDALMPEGWKLVPVAPNEAMLHAAEDVATPRPYGAVYKAMLAAAPEFK